MLTFDHSRRIAPSSLPAASTAVPGASAARAALAEQTAAARRVTRNGQSSYDSASSSTPGVFTSPAAIAPAPTEPVTRAFDVNDGTPGPHTIIAGSPGYRIAVYGLDLYNVDTEQDCRFLDGTTGQEFRGGLPVFAAKSGFMLQPAAKPLYKLSPGQSLVLDLSAGGRVTGTIHYLQEAV